MKRKRLRDYLPIFLLFIIFLFFAVQINYLQKEKASNQQDVSSKDIKLNIPIEEKTENSFKPIQLSASLKKGETPSMALDRMGIENDLKHQIIDHLSSLVDFRKCRPGDSFCLTIEPSGQLLRGSFTKSPFETFVMERGENEDIFQVFRDSFSLERHVVKISGSIEGSLFDSFEKAGADDRMVLSFADIFASKIDFNSDLQPGDEFSLIVEKFYKDGEFIGNGRIIAASFRGDIGNFNAFYLEEHNRKGYFDLDGKSLSASFLKSPLQVFRITSKFTNSRLHPILNEYKPHHGIDLAAPAGTAVMAASAGEVIYAGWQNGYGNIIILRHNGGYETYYAHLSGFAKGIKKGANVQQKQVIGYVGATGLATGPHLDYRIKHKNMFVDPLKIKALPSEMLAGNTQKSFISKISHWKTALQNTVPSEILMVEKKITNAPPDGWKS